MTPMKPLQVRWNEPLGEKECPYMYRWVFNFWLFAIRIHRWVRSDDKRHFHDHPWGFITIVLKGGYVDVSPDKRDVLSPGSIRYRSAYHKHYVEVPEEGCTTLLITGPPIRNWGFWIGDRFKRPLKYFHKYGHPPCSEQ